MISVLIADDEYLLRSLIRKSIQWEKFGLEVIGEASDGEEALDTICKYNPDIAIVDINMPFMNGLELAKQVKDLSLKTQIIILTGYDKFEYAKEAILYRVFEYILKPIDFEELTYALVKLGDEILKKKEAVKNLSQKSQEAYKGRSIIKNQFLYDIAFQRLDFEQNDIKLREEFSKFNMKLERDNLCTIALQLDGLEGLKPSDSALYSFIMLNIAKEALSNTVLVKNIETFTSTDNNAYIFFNVNHEGKDGQECLVAECQKIIDMFNQFYQYTISIGIGNIYSGYSNIHKSIQEAQDALKKRFYKNGNKVFSADSSYDSNNEFNNLQYPNIEEIIRCIERSDGLVSINTLKSIFQTFREKAIPEDYVRMSSMSLVAVLYSIAKRNQWSLDKFEVKKIFSIINRSQMIDELERNVLHFYESCLKYLSDQKGNTVQKSHVVLEAKEYINNNFEDNNISLKKIASATYVNATYLSDLFKKEMGISIIEYITMCRMKKALNLINTNYNMNINFVSKAVGYTDSYYFSKCFKKYYGISPSKFLSEENREIVEDCEF